MGIYKSLTDTFRAIPFLGIHNWDLSLKCIVCFRYIVRDITNGAQKTSYTACEEVYFFLLCLAITYFFQLSFHTEIKK
jgi:hypothetical protein